MPQLPRMVLTPFTLDLVRGAADLESTARGTVPHRLPSWVREQFPDPQLMAMEAQPSGIRLAFRTSSTRFDLVVHPHRVTYVGADRPRGRIDVVVDGVRHLQDELTGGDQLQVDLRTGASTAIPGEEHTLHVEGLAGDEKRIDVWLPHNEALELISLSSDSPVRPAPASPVRWVHYGSSISQGSNAASPSAIWPGVAARTAGDVDLRNLGFGGSALVDPFMARVIRDLPADLISAKVGINVVNLDAMRLRSFVPAIHGFLDTIRDGHPTTPLVLISPIFCGMHESTPGPLAVDPDSLGTDQVRFIATGTAGDTQQGRLTLEVIRDALRDVVERRQDAHLHYLDGTALYGPDDADQHPLPDGLHPDTATHELIGRRFADHLPEYR